VAIKTDWDGFEDGPISDDFDDVPPEIIQAETVGKMVEAAAVMGLNLEIRLRIGGEVCKITVENDPDVAH
jgi:hypothetical protein